MAGVPVAAIRLTAKDDVDWRQVGERVPGGGIPRSVSAICACAEVGGGGVFGRPAGANEAAGGGKGAGGEFWMRCQVRVVSCN